MKKMIVMIAAVVLAGSTYASKVQWGTVIGDANALGATFNGASIYLVLGTGISGAEQTTLGAMTAFTFASIYGTTSDGYFRTGTMSASGTYAETFTFSNGGATGLSGTGALATYPGTGSQSIYMVAIASDGKTMAFSPTVTTSIVTSTLSTTNWRPAGTWSTIVAVPEPTSMALLALGVAAIGMRRRFQK